MQPATADDLRTNKELPATLVDPEFAEARGSSSGFAACRPSLAPQTVRELMTAITEQMAEPVIFNGAPLTGPRLAQLTHQVAKLLNEGSAISVPRQAQRRRRRRR